MHQSVVLPSHQCNNTAVINFLRRYNYITR